MKHPERLKQRPSLEPLEDRRLLAAPITEFPIPAGSPGITAGPDGNLWFTLLDDQIGRITPAGQVTEFSIPPSTSGPNRITAGPDGNLWFTYGSRDYQIGRITPAGQVTVFPTPAANQSSVPFDIAAGPDGNVWFTETEGNKIGRITPAGQVTEFPVSLEPLDIEAGPDGNLWFTESEPVPPQFGQRNMIGRVSPAGQVTEFPLNGFLMSGEAFGPDGNLWFATGVYQPLAGGPPGAAKLAEFLSRMTPAGQVTSVPLSGFDFGGSLPELTMTFGPDGILWYTAPERNAIGRITSAGLAFEFSIPTSPGGTLGIVAGPDGNLWFSERDGDRIGRFRVATTDLSLAVPAPTITGTAGQPLTYTISVTNHGPVEATDVILTEELPASTVPVVSLMSDTRFVSASQGSVTQVAGGGFVAELGNLASGATATVTIVMKSANPRTRTSQLAVHANESDSNPGDDTAALTAIINQASNSNQASSIPPHVLRLNAVRVKRKGLTAIVVTFDQPMDPGHVSSVGIYHLVSVGKGKRPRLKPVGLASASYDAASRFVRLALRKPFKTGTLRLTIDHAAALSAGGMGLAGGDYIATVPR